MKYNDRFLYIMQEFNDQLALNIIRQLFELDNKSNKDIILVINSDGGDTSALFAIHDAMRIIKSKVATICIGRAYSAAACILVSGSKGKRFITPYSDVMFHEISSEVDGTVSSIKDELVSIEHCDKMVLKIVTENLAVPYKKVLKRRKDAYYNANEALKIGAVDFIVNSIDDMLPHIDI